MSHVKNLEVCSVIHSETFIPINNTLRNYRQTREERKPLDFADRRRGLSQKILCKVDDRLVQRIHRENAERVLLASFVGGLTGVSGRQIRYANSSQMEQSLTIAITVQEAEKQESFNESSYTSFVKSGYYDVHPVGSATKKASRGNQLTPRRRTITWVVSVISLCVAPASR